MSERLLVKEARRRAEVFKNLPKHLKTILDTVRRIDENAEAYLFGSVAEERHVLSSDIDILVVTERPPGKVLATLWERGIKEPFEVHVVSREKLKIYARRAKLLRIDEYIRKAGEDSAENNRHNAKRES
ncbi:MAG: nucleotidyltransferase domain-containing protein [Thermoplasmata archaeon]|nr:MAG: nucleotidyltransferase domain-containing protein [Thermoplasmata archaeon]